MEILKALGWSLACFDMFLFGLVLLGVVLFMVGFHNRKEKNGR